ncbi:MAG: energy-coupling factor transporter ATPase [Bacillota bacterium]
MQPVIKVNNITHTYGEGETAKKALDGVSLEIFQGEFVAILGHNGSGKSTLARHLNALLTPTTGDVEVFGYNSKENETLFEIRKNVGMVFQNPDNQMIATIVEDDIAFGPENIGLPREEIIARVDFALKAVDMEKFRTSTPFKLSGGQKQRIAIAGVVALKPKVIILDESTAMLDPRGRKEVLDVMMSLRKSENISIVLITHFMDEALKADKVVVMESGKITLMGSPQDVFARTAEIEKASLKLPRAQKLCENLKELGIPIASAISEEELLEGICKLNI